MLVLADSGRESRYADLRRAVYSLLKHCGFPWRVCDLATGMPDPDDLKCAAAIIMAQEGVAASIDPATMKSVVEAVRGGVGLVVLDPALKSLPADMRSESGIRYPGAGKLAGPLKAAAGRHFVTHFQSGHNRAVPENIRAGYCKPSGKATVFLEDGRGRTICLGGRIGEGRLFVFSVSNEFWLPDNFGHGNGLSDVLWRGIVWAARKPLVTLMCPPFVCARIDDAVGDTAGGIAFARPDAYPDWEGFPFFEYAASFREYGFPAHVGLYLDHVTRSAARRAVLAAEDHEAEFSQHSFSWSRGIHFSPGKGPVHDDLAAHYMDVADEQFRRWGISAPRVLAPHLGECGSNAALELLRRGRPYCNGFIVPDEPLHGEHQCWSPYPFGCCGIVYDTFPQNKGLRYIYSGPVSPEVLSFKKRDGCDWFRIDLKSWASEKDFLWQRWPDRAAGRRKADVAAAAQAGTEQVLHGLSNAFFGCLATREAHLARFSREQFRDILERIGKQIDDCRPIPARLSDICEYVWNWKDCNLDSVNLSSGARAEFKISGRSDVRLKLGVFIEKQGDIVLRFAELPRFDNGYQGALKTA